jgi:hypothetical protein
MVNMAFIKVARALVAIGLITLATSVKAGIVGYGWKDSAMVTIPMFEYTDDIGLAKGGTTIRYTEDALLYGQQHKDDKDVIATLRYWSREYDKQFKKFMDSKYEAKKDNISMKEIRRLMEEGSEIALKGQLVREALSVMNVGAEVYFGEEPIKEK